MCTRVQSASISSASNMGKDVITPCPISDLSTIKVIQLSAVIRMNAFGAKGASSASVAMPPACAIRSRTGR